MTEWNGSEVIIKEPVKFVGDPKDDPENNPGFQTWEKAFREVYQPERSKREDSVKDYAGKLPDFPLCGCTTEMRCSEHDSNIVRDK